MKKIDFDIRKAEVSDVDDLYNILHENWSSAHFTSFFNEKQMKKYLTCMVKMNEYGFVISEKEDFQNKVVGFIIAGINTDRALNQYLRNNFIYVFVLFFNKLNIFISLNAKIIIL